MMHSVCDQSAAMRLLPLIAFLPNVWACLPLGLGFGPYGGMYPAPAYGGFYGPRLGPFRSEPQHGQALSADSRSSGPRFDVQLDEVQSAVSLNCPKLTEENQCKWGNANEDELDWGTVAATPNADRWFTYLGTQNLPDQGALALVSQSRNGWEGGRLVSDMVPCVGEGMRFTATAWRTKTSNEQEEPRLQICTRNAGDEKMPLINCNEFDVRNGVPITVEVPPPSNSRSPAQLVLSGINFIGPYGGAIFVQDIVVEGSTTCTGESLDNPHLIEDIPQPVQDGNTENRGASGSAVGPLKEIEINALEAIDAPNRPQYESRQSLNALQNNFEHHKSAAHSVSSNSISGTPSLFESCLALSCNPSDLTCKFWRSSGNNRWEIGSANRIANPLTGIHLPPGTSQKFLVAPFLDTHISSYTLVTEQLTIPPLQEVYFCFYEYYATHGLSLSVCTDKMDCFYRKTTLAVGNAAEENKRWNIRCAKLPVGSYELRVVAENFGENKGEVGFLPIRLSRDPEGVDFIC